MSISEKSTLPLKPKLNPFVQISILDNDRVLISSPFSDFVVKGENISHNFTQIQKFLTGKFSSSQIKKFLKEKIHLFNLILELNEKGFLLDGSVHDNIKLSKQEMHVYEDQLNFFTGFGFNSAQKQQLLKKSKIIITGTKNLLNPLLLNISQSGVGNISILSENKKSDSIIAYNKFSKFFFPDTDIDTIIKTKQFDFFVLCQESPTVSEIKKLNKLCIENDIPWLYVGVDAAKCIIGPMIIPRKSGCYTCYQNWIKNNNPEKYQLKLTRDKVNSKIGLKASYNIASSIAGVEIIKYLAGIETNLINHVFYFDIFKFSNYFENFYKDPYCLDCGVH